MANSAKQLARALPGRIKIGVAGHGKTGIASRELGRLSKRG